MIELGDRVETMQGQEGIVAASPRNGQGWLIQLDGGKTVRRWDEELWLCDQEDARMGFSGE
jgi:hypothetical protein